MLSNRNPLIFFKKSYIVFLLMLCLLGACKEKEGPGQENDWELIGPTYAETFELFKNEEGQIKIRTNHMAEERDYFLVEEEAMDKDADGIDNLKIPLTQWVCTSTSHLPALEALGVEQYLVGFPNLDLIYSPVFRNRIAEGKIKDLGKQAEPNLESLLQLKPDLVMAYTMSSSVRSVEKWREAGLKVMVNSDFQEHHPLGRAEWIKVHGFLTQKEEEASAVFSQIEARYQRLKNWASERNTNPTVFTGVMYGDQWFMPAGGNYAARFFEDAGASYLFREEGGNTWIEKSFESVLQKAKGADYWIGVADHQGYDELIQSNEKYQYFKAFENRKVYHFMRRLGEKGGNDYLESAYLRPDLVLWDLLWILYPSDRESLYALHPNGEDEAILTYFASLE